MTTSPYGDAVKIGSRILELIAEQGITKSQLATASGIPDTTLRRKLDDRPETLTFVEVANISRALNTPVADLYETALRRTE